MQDNWLSPPSNSFNSFLGEQLNQEREYQQGEAGRQELRDANPGALILSPAMRGKQTGADNMAKVYRAEWEDYLARFAPIENMLFDKFNDAEGRAASVEKAGQTMGLAFDQSKDQTNRTISRYGLNMSPEQQANRDRSMEVQRAAGVAGAKNGMRIAKEDQRMGIMAGGLSSVKQQNKGA